MTQKCYLRSYPHSPTLAAHDIQLSVAVGFNEERFSVINHFTSVQYHPV